MLFSVLTSYEEDWGFCLKSFFACGNLKIDFLPSALPFSPYFPFTSVILILSFAFHSFIIFPSLILLRKHWLGARDWIFEDQTGRSSLDPKHLNHMAAVSAWSDLQRGVSMAEPPLEMGDVWWNIIHIILYCLIFLFHYSALRAKRIKWAEGELKSLRVIVLKARAVSVTPPACSLSAAWYSIILINVQLIQLNGLMNQMLYDSIWTVLLTSRNCA